jgi:transcription antitermination factor NusG
MRAVQDCELLEQTNSGQDLASWFAVQTRPRHERAVATQLETLGFDTFAPVVAEIHHWSDRRKKVELPLFPSYAFVKLCPSPAERVRVLRLFGVNGFVGSRGQGTPIPDKQIDDIQTLLANDIDFALTPFLKIGQRVRVRGGCLDGIEGVLMARNSDQTLVISVEPIQQSLSIRIDGHNVEPI